MQIFLHFFAGRNKFRDYEGLKDQQIAGAYTIYAGPKGLKNQSGGTTRTAKNAIFAMRRGSRQ